MRLAMKDRFRNPLLIVNALFLFICFFTASTSIPAISSQLQPGDACTTLGKVVSFKTANARTDFICKSQGKRKVWQVLKTENTKSQPSKSGSTGQSKEPSSGVTTTKGKPAAYPFQNVGIDLSSDPWQWSSAKDLGPFQPIKIFGRIYLERFKEQALTFMMLKPGTKVYSPVNGKILDVRLQPESCDSEIYIVFDESNWLTLSFDHVTAVKDLRKGSNVKSGDLIATVPKWDCKSAWGGVEFMYVQPEVNTALCPLQYIEPSASATFKSQIMDVMRKWNSEVGDISSAYTSADLERGPCEVLKTPISKS